MSSDKLIGELNGSIEKLKQENSAEITKQNQKIKELDDKIVEIKFNSFNYNKLEFLEIKNYFNKTSFNLSSDFLNLPLSLPYDDLEGYISFIEIIQNNEIIVYLLKDIINEDYVFHVNYIEEKKLKTFRNCLKSIKSINKYENNGDEKD